MFAALYLERDPLQLADLPKGLISWILDVGGFAAVGILIWVLVRASSSTGWRFGAVPGYDPPSSDPRYSPPPTWVSVIFTWAAMLSAVVYVVFFLSYVPVFRDL